MRQEPFQGFFAKWLPLAVLWIIILFGGYVRLANLGVEEFESDELNLYFAAKSIEVGEGPLLPSGEVYDRGVDISRLIVLTNRYIEDPELAARLPSALFGILSLVVFAVVASRIAGLWVSVWATLLLTIFPEMVHQSRITRFYTYQLNFGLLAFYAGWQMLKPSAAPQLAVRHEIIKQWLWFFVAVSFFILAMRVQITTLSVMLGWGLSVGLAAVADAWRHGRKAWTRSVPFQVAGAGLVFLCAFFIAFPGIVVKWLLLASYIPLWAESAPGNSLFYYYALSEALPLAFSLFPLVFIAVAYWNPKLAVYLFVWFVVPLFLHSFVFAWKGTRFILLALPALFLAYGIAASLGCGALYQAVRSWPDQSSQKTIWRNIIAGSIVSVVSVFAVMTTPAFNAVRKIPAESMFKQVNWEKAAEIIHSLPENESIPVGSSMPDVSLFYWGRVDFVVLRSALEQGGKDGGEANVGGVVILEEGARDFYTGVPVLTTPNGIRRHFSRANSVVIAFDMTRWVYGNIDPQLKSLLPVVAVELCRGRCGNMLLFHWKFKTS